MHYHKVITLILTFSIIILLCCCWGVESIKIDKAPEKQHDCCQDASSDTDGKHQKNESDCEHKNLKQLLNESLVIDKNQVNLHAPGFEPVYTITYKHRISPSLVYAARQIKCEPNASPRLEVHCVYLL